MSDSTDGRSADAAFGLLADGTRVEILRAVAVKQSELPQRSGPMRLSFSDIYDAVAVDNTSKLSYHLGELTGTFLRKDEDGYAFTHAGEELVRFVLSGNYERPPAFGPVETRGTCLFCGATELEARFQHELFFVVCTDCEEPAMGYFLKPAQARAWDGEELVRMAVRKQTFDYRQVRRGVCPTCAGPLSTEVMDAGDSPLPDADSFVAVDRCEACLRRYSGPLTYGVAHHPASVAFHWDHGIDVLAEGFRLFNDRIREGRWTSERAATDSDEYAVELREGDDVLRARLDDTATVIHTERVRRSGVGQPE